ncbi:MAG: hypothetical protein FWD34_03695 [Oscillospiraceae bacterium]|nr:hypothetical protein [Oscillospiraceae bacterium]
MENKKNILFPIVGASVLGVFAIGAIIFLATRPDPVEPAPVESTTEATTTEATNGQTESSAPTTAATNGQTESSAPTTAATNGQTESSAPTTEATTTEAATIDTTDYSTEPEEFVVNDISDIILDGPPPTPPPTQATPAQANTTENPNPRMGETRANGDYWSGQEWVPWTSGSASGRDSTIGTGDWDNIVGW